MSDNIQLYKANIGKEVHVKELETLIASSGALIQRVDQAEGRSVVFFSGDKDAVDQYSTSLAQVGEVTIEPASQDDLLKLP